MQIQILHKIEFKKLCQKYGKKLSECMPYVIKQEGVMWHVDISKFNQEPKEVTTEPPAIVEEVEVTTTKTPQNSFTYSFYNRKYTKE